jgi:hypothetical protein
MEEMGREGKGREQKRRDPGVLFVFAGLGGPAQHHSATVL